MVSRGRTAGHRFALLAAGGFLSAVPGSGAAEAMLEWDPVENCAGYRLCYGTGPGSHPQVLEAGAATSLKVTGLTPGTTYYFVAKAYSETGLESDPSNEVAHTPSKAAQQITFAPLPDKTIGDEPFTLSATGGGSGRPVTFTLVSGPAALSAGNTLTVTATGVVTVRAAQEGSGDYLAAPEVMRSFTVRPLKFSGWKERNFTAGQLADPALEAVLWGKEANPDGDARPNAWEYALGSDPLVFDPEPVPVMSLDPGSSADTRRAAFSFTRSRYAAGSAVITPEVSGASGSFTELQNIAEVTTAAGGMDIISYVDNTGVSASAVRRVRLKLQMEGESGSQYGEIHATRGFTVAAATRGLLGIISAQTTYAGAPLVEPLLAAGRVAATGSFTLTPDGIPWPETLLEENGPCYLVLTGGPNAGINVTLTGLAGGVLSLSDNLTGIALPGDPFAVRRHHTLGGVFEKTNAGTLQGGGAGATADNVSFVRTNGTEDTQSRTVLAGDTRWRTSAGQPADSRVILPEEGFLIIRRTLSSVTLFQQGVTSGDGGAVPLIVPVERGTNLFCLPFSTGSCTLDQSGLYTGNANTGLNAMLLYSNAGDSLSVPQAGGTGYFYSALLGTGWRSSGLQASGSLALAPGSVLIINRLGIYPAFPWRMPARP